MSITILDVAKHAGVSTATISRYLNDINKLSPKTREKVKKSMEILDYEPNFMAQTLAGINCHTIAFAINVKNEQTYGNQFFSLLQFGIEQELASRNYYLFIVDTDNTDDISGIAKVVKEKRVAGIIIPRDICTLKLKNFLRKENCPYVVIGYPQEDEMSGADINNYRGAMLAVEKLISNGRKRIAYVSPVYGEGSMLHMRFDGYKEMLKKHSIKYDPNIVMTDCLGKEMLKAFVDRMIESGNMCDAIISTDSKYSFILVQYLKAKGFEFPKDIELIGFDDTELMTISDPEISTIKVDVKNLGKILGRKIIEQIETGVSEPKLELLDCSLILRGTSN